MKFMVCVLMALPLGLMGQAITSSSSAEAKIMLPAHDEATPSELQIEKLKRTAAQMELLQAQYKIQEYNQATKPIMDEQEAVFAEVCATVGVPRDAIKTECGLTIGGKGPDGKVTPPRVWRIRQPVETSSAK